MAHHHKSNKKVEGNPDYGHGRGLPRRPDEDQLEERTVEDRREMGLRVRKQPSPEKVYEEERIEVDFQVAEGEVETGKGPRKFLGPFPASHHDD